MDSCYYSKEESESRFEPWITVMYIRNGVRSAAYVLVIDHTNLSVPVDSSLHFYFRRKGRSHCFCCSAELGGILYTGTIWLYERSDVAV